MGPDSSFPSSSPSPKQQSWGALLSIIIIVLMVIIGAYYSWSKRISQINTASTPAAIDAAFASSTSL